MQKFHKNSSFESQDYNILFDPIFPSSYHPSLFQRNTKRAPLRQEMLPQGLLGYYFHDNAFTNLILMQAGQSHHRPWAPNPAYIPILSKKLQNFGSIRWVGRIFVPQTGTYRFSSSLGIDVRMSIVVTRSYGPNRDLFYKEYVAIDSESTLYPIQLQQGNFYEIMIEYCPTIPHQSLQLYWSYNSSSPELIPNKYLLFPMTHPDNRKQKQLIPGQSLFKLLTNKGRSMEDTRFVFRNKIGDFGQDQDTDGDLIPDDWEQNGYTAIPTEEGIQVIKWEDKYGAEMGYTKYISNPFLSSSAKDSFTDFEKVAVFRMNPLVAAYPIIGVSLEKVIVASTETVSSHEDHSVHSDHSYTNTENVRLDFSLLGGTRIGVAADYSHSDTNSAGKSDTTGSSLQISASAAATANFNLRYYNTGNIDLYNVKPTMNFIMGKGAQAETIATITPQRELGQEAHVVPTDGYYPEKSQPPIALLSADQFNSGAVHLNLNQFHRFLQGESIWVSTSQVAGEYPAITSSMPGGGLLEGGGPPILTNWHLTSGGGEYSQIQHLIDTSTTSIILNIGGKDMLPRERRIAAKDPTNPLDRTPVLTLKEALLAIDNVSMKDDRLIYTIDSNGIRSELSLEESAVQIVTDEPTANQIQTQQPKISRIYDVVISPKMNFTIRFSDIYDDANQGMNNDIFSWKNTKDFIQDSVEPNGYCYFAVKPAFGVLTREASQILEANSRYLLSTYVKLPAEEALTLKQSATATGDQTFEQTIVPIFHNMAVYEGEILTLTHVESQLYFIDLKGKRIHLPELFPQAPYTREISLNITKKGFQFENQIFKRVDVEGLPMPAFKGSIEINTDSMTLVVNGGAGSLIHPFFSGQLYFSMKLLAPPVFRLGMGSGETIEQYTISSPFPISSASQWIRLQFLFDVGDHPANMNTVLILPDPLQQTFYFDAISLTKVQSVQKISTVPRESELLESMYRHPVHATVEQEMLMLSNYMYILMQYAADKNIKNAAEYVYLYINKNKLTEQENANVDSPVLQRFQQEILNPLQQEITRWLTSNNFSTTIQQATALLNLAQEIIDDAIYYEHSLNIVTSTDALHVHQQKELLKNLQSDMQNFRSYQSAALQPFIVATNTLYIDPKNYEFTKIFATALGASAVTNKKIDEKLQRLNVYVVIFDLSNSLIPNLGNALQFKITYDLDITIKDKMINPGNPLEYYAFKAYVNNNEIGRTSFTSHDKFKTRTLGRSTLLGNDDNVVKVVRELDGKEFVEFYENAKNITTKD